LCSGQINRLRISKLFYYSDDYDGINASLDEDKFYKFWNNYY